MTAVWISMTVGFRQGRLEDSSRPNWDGSGPRPLRWFAWYPPADGAIEQELRASDTTAAWFSYRPAARDAALSRSGARHPIVMLSHGTGGTALWAVEARAGSTFDLEPSSAARLTCTTKRRAQFPSFREIPARNAKRSWALHLSGVPGSSAYSPIEQD